MENIISLPQIDELNIAALSRLFSNTTNSYKYLFFLSLLDILKSQHFENTFIKLQDLMVRMLVKAWYPHTYFKLSFGKQDKIAENLKSFNLPFAYSNGISPSLNEGKLIQQINSYKIDNSLMKYVPYRLMTPFFDDELRKVKKDNDKNSLIIKLCNNHFYTKKPIYKFIVVDMADAIVVHPQWIVYLRIHFSIVKAWVSWEWLKYMQKCNPNVPAVVNKLYMPQKRESLKEQTQYWKVVLAQQQVSCIYSKKILEKEAFSLDHYLPWSFLVHDQLWNLIPTFHEVNSSKSDNLPSEQYFQQFVDLQHLGLTLSCSLMAKNDWIKYVECFFSDLKVSDEQALLQKDKLKSAYETTLLPLLSLAITQGFSPEWSYTL